MVYLSCKGVTRDCNKSSYLDLPFGAVFALNPTLFLCSCRLRSDNLTGANDPRDSFYLVWTNGRKGNNNTVITYPQHDKCCVLKKSRSLELTFPLVYRSSLVERNILFRKRGLFNRTLELRSGN